MNRLRILVSALLVFGVLAGCGGDDDDALTEAQFTEQGNKICEDGGKELDAAGDAAFGSGAPTADDAEAFFDDTAIPNIRGQLDDIEALDEPEDLSDDLDAFLEDARAKLDEIEALDGDELLELVSSGEDPFADVNAQANDLGLTTCGAA
jgi:hypothetical protein